MKPVILQISAGSDIIGSIVEFATKKQVGVIVLSATGSVRDVTLSWPRLFVKGPFDIMSLSGSFGAGFCPCCDFKITLVGRDFRVFGGMVIGKVVAAGQVRVVVGVMSNRPTVYKVLPDGTMLEQKQEEEKEEEANPTLID